MAIHSFHVGGCELQLLNLCKELQELAIEPIIIYSKTANSQRFHSTEELKFYYVPAIFYKFRIVHFYLHYLFRWKIGRMPDLFHCHASSRFTEQVLWFAQMCHIPTLVKITTGGHVTEIKEKIEQRIGIGAIIRRFLSRSHKIKEIHIENALFGKHRFDTFSKVNGYLCINPSIQEELESFPIHNDKLFPIPNGVNSDRFKPVPEVEKGAIKKSLGLPHEMRYIMMPVRFVSRKRICDLIHAWANIESNYPSHLLLLVGDGIERQAMEQLAENLGIRGRIIFAGMQSNLEKYFQITDVFAFTSQLEGLPNAVLEAMSSALPIVATSIAGIKEIIVPNLEGILFPPGEVTALTHSLTYLLDHPEEARKMGAAAREKILKEYSFAIIAPRFNTLYRKLLYACPREGKRWPLPIVGSPVNALEEASQL